MKQAVQINIGGRYFHIDEDAYLLLKQYLDALKDHFIKDKESGIEIIEDIEHRMAELLESRLSNIKQVITLEDANETIKILGNIEDFEFAEEKEESQKEYKSTYYAKEGRRLYRDPDNSYLAGVSAGLGAYFNIDPLWPRLVFIALSFAHGFGLILYIILWIIVPKARTTAQKLQMKGEPVTVQNIEKSISDEYQKVKTNIHKMRKSDRYQRTEGVFVDILNGIGLLLKAFLKLIISIIGIAFIVVGIILIVGIGIAFFTSFNLFGAIHWPSFNFPGLSDIFIEFNNISLIAICIIILISVPIISLIYAGIKLIFNIKSRNRFLRATAITAWILALIFLITLVFVEGENMAFEASGSSEYSIKNNNYSTLYIDKKDEYDIINSITVYSIFDFDIYYNRHYKTILGKPKLNIVKGRENHPQLVIKKYARNVSLNYAGNYLDELEYNWEQQDSILYFDQFFTIDKDKKWRFPKVELTLKIPENTIIYISRGMEDILHDIDNIHFYREDDMTGQRWIMTNRGLKLFKTKITE